jgi:6-phosphogluconolactonase
MPDVSSDDIRISESAEAMAQAVADWICGLARSTDRAFAVCLAGGETPRRIYQVLADPPVSGKFPWHRVHWFWGDERCVPHDHPASNYRMVREALISRAPVPAGNVHPIPTENMSPQRAALAYESELKRFYGADRLDPARPLFDVTLLGLGTDGHTASLFPGHAALREQRRWSVAVIGAMPEPRITLTIPVLDSSRELAFLVSGESKRRIFERVRSGDPALPAGGIHPAGPRRWFADRAAAPA